MARCRILSCIWPLYFEERFEWIVNIRSWKDLEFFSEDGDQRISSNDKKKPETALRSLGILEENFYAECLLSLEAFFATDQEKIFYWAFVYAYWEVYFKRLKNKRRYWNFRSLLVSLVGASGGVVVLAGVFAFLTNLFTLLNTVLSNLTKSGAEEVKGILGQGIALVKTYWLPSCVLLAAILAAWGILRFIFACLRQEAVRRNYQEAWVRHSITYHRLNSAMVQFLSGMVGKPEFMKTVVEILGDNIERFQNNMRVQRVASEETDQIGNSDAGN